MKQHSEDVSNLCIPFHMERLRSRYSLFHIQTFKILNQDITAPFSICLDENIFIYKTIRFIEYNEEKYQNNDYINYQIGINFSHTNWSCFGYRKK